MGWSINRPTGLTWHNNNLSTKGYTLFTPHGDSHTYLIDIQGRIVHVWKFSDIKPGYGRLLSNGNLLITGSDVDLPDPPKNEPTKPPPPFERHIMRLGGYHTTLREVSWEGDTVWEYVNRAQHHDFHRLSNGNTIVPEWVELPQELHRRVKGGFKEYREQLPRLLGDDLVEINAKGEEVRRLHTWKMLDPIKDPIRPDKRRWEWTHLNGLDINDTGEIVISCRCNDRVCVINDFGEMIWKWDKTHGQHNPTWLQNGNILIFDNGDSSSRVIEVNTSNSEIEWQYTGKPAHQFYSGHISGANSLESGNVLICEGTSGRIFEVNRNQEVVWEWINPFLNHNRYGETSVSIYRAHRYSPDHPALINHDLNPDDYSNLNRTYNLL